MKENRNESLTKADLQTILDHITDSTRKVENYINAELAHINNKLDALQADVSEIIADVKQVKEDINVITSDSGYKRDEKGKLKLT